jgi:hypothetical protein
MRSTMVYAIITSIFALSSGAKPSFWSDQSLASKGDKADSSWTSDEASSTGVVAASNGNSADILIRMWCVTGRGPGDNEYYYEMESWLQDRVKVFKCPYERDFCNSRDHSARTPGYIADVT